MSTTRPHRSTALPVALVLAGLLMGAGLLVDLTPSTDGTAGLLTAIADQPGRWRLTGTLFMLSGLAWAVAGAALVRELGGRSRLVGAAGLALGVGGTALALLDAAGFFLPVLARSGVSPEEQVRIVEGVEGSVPVVAAELVHLAGWGVGMLLLVAGLLVSRAVPRWVPVLLLLSLVGMVAFIEGAPLAAAVVAHVAALTGLAVRLRGRTTVPAAKVTSPSFG